MTASLFVRNLAILCLFGTLLSLTAAADETTVDEMHEDYRNLQDAGREIQPHEMLHRDGITASSIQDLESLFPAFAPIGEPIPTLVPSWRNDELPTFAVPTKALSRSPSMPVHQPTIGSFDPTLTPSELPSYSPTESPSDLPSYSPTLSPSKSSSSEPTFMPSHKALQTPSPHPSWEPSRALPFVPTESPTGSPSTPDHQPTMGSFDPTLTPSDLPSYSPNAVSPSDLPSYSPTLLPSKTPSSEPTFNVPPWSPPVSQPTSPTGGSAGWVQTGKQSAEITVPKKPSDPPRVSTRGKETGYTPEGTIPGLKDGKNCPPELVVYVHGFKNKKETAKENFRLVKKSLEQLGYHHPVVGYTWDSDVGWFKAVSNATRNGKQLAKFLLEYKCKCPDTKIRLMAHSLGSRVVLNALKSLNEDKDKEKWNEEDYKIRSVHLLGAAVDNEEVGTKKGFGTYIEKEVDEFHNKYSKQDDVLGLYLTDKALGKKGAQSGITLPRNYKEQKVDKEIIRDTDGDGDYEEAFKGDNHSGYIGVMSGNVLAHSGVIDIAVNEWLKQEGGDKRRCLARVTLASVSYRGRNVGNKWRFSVSAGGDYKRFSKKPLRYKKTWKLAPEKMIFRRRIAGDGDMVSMDFKINAIEVDPFRNDKGMKSTVFQFRCDGTDYKFVVPVHVHEKKKTAILLFHFKVYTTILGGR